MLQYFTQTNDSNEFSHEAKTIEVKNGNNIKDNIKITNKSHSKKNLINYRTYKVNKKIIFLILTLLISLDLIYPILSDLSITLNIEMYSGNTYNIINTKYIGPPAEIYSNNVKIQNLTNLSLIYENDYLKIYCMSYIVANIKLVWRSSISKKSPTTIIEMATNIPENNINEETATEYIIPEDFQLNAYGLFKDCNNIRSIDFSDFETTFMYNMSHMFDSCTNLQNVTDLSPINSQDMSYMFYRCQNLNSFN